MSELFIYLLKVSAGIAIFLLPYYFLFRNDPNLVLKRAYLLLGLFSSWIFPLIVFRRPELIVNLTPIVVIDPLGAEAPPLSLTETGSKTGLTINWVQVLVITYIIGLAFMFVKNLFIITKWNLTWKKTKDKDGIAFTGSDQVFTLFSRIFIPRSLKNNQDLDNVLLHEKAHVQQLHFVDLILMEFTLLLTWFNPFSWLISRMIKENHEHLADRQVLTTGVNPARYRAQLLNHTLGVNVFRLGNQFNHSLTLKRFKMMKKPKKSPLGILKIALLLPAILVTLGLTTGMTPQEKTVKGKVVIAESGEPAPGASIVIQGTTIGTVSDIDGTFMLNVDGNPEIVISFVGYASIKVKASEIGKKPLQLKPEAYMMDLESVPLKVIQEGKDDITLSPKEVKEISDQQNSDENEGEVFFIVEEMPMFHGGKAELKTYIYSNLVYPESAMKKGISGEVMVQFNVKGSGELEYISVARSTHEEFEKPAMDVFKGMPAWSPGKQRGKPVKVKVIVPVVFNADTE